MPHAVAERTSPGSPISHGSAQSGAAPVLGVFLCGAMAFLELYCTQPLLPFFAHVFHATEAQAGLTISGSTLGVALSAALLALFGEHIPRKSMILASMTALALATLLTATAQSLHALVLCRVLQGLMTPGIFITTIAYITEEWPALQVPRVMSRYVAGTVFGGFAGRILAGLIASHFHWRTVFVVLGLTGLAGAAGTTRLLPSPRSLRPGKQHASPFAPIAANLRNPRLLATFAIGFCMLFTLVSLFSYVAFYLAAPPFHLSTTALSWLFTVYLVGLGATLVVGPVLPRIGLRAGIVGAILLCLTGTALTLSASLTLIAVGLALGSSGIFIAQTCANSFLRDAAPAGGRVSAAGMYIFSYYIGGTVGGVLPGWAWRHAGWPGCTALIALMLTIAGLTAWFCWPSHTRRHDPIPV